MKRRRERARGYFAEASSSTTHRACSPRTATLLPRRTATVVSGFAAPALSDRVCSGFRSANFDEDAIVRRIDVLASARASHEVRRVKGVLVDAAFRIERQHGTIHVVLAR